MADYEYEDLLGGDAPPVEESNPLDRALKVIHQLAAVGQAPTPAAPAAVVGDALAAPQVAVPDRLASEGLSVGSGAPVAPTGTERPAEYTPELSPAISGALGNDTDVEDPNRNRYRSSYAARTVDEATAQVDDQLNRVAKTREDYNRAKDAAAADHATKMVQASEDAAEEQLLLGVKSDRTIEMINARTDAEIANNLKNLSMLAKQEPNPARWWENQSGLGKAIWALSLVFGAAHTTLTPGARNAALDMVTQEIARDVAMQEARTKREMAVEEMKGTVIRDKGARNRSDAMHRADREYTRIMALERAWQARAALPGDLDAQAGKLEAQAWFEQTKLPIVAGRREELVNTRIREEQQRFQSGMQASAQKFQTSERQARETFDAGENERNRQLQRDLAQIKIDAKTSTNAQGIPLDKDGIPVLRVAPSGVRAGKTTGAMLLGPDGKPATNPAFPGLDPGTVVFRKEDDKQAKDFSATNTGANRRFKAMARIYDLLGDTNRATNIAAGITDAELNGLVTQLGTEGAKADDPGGRYTDKDFSRGVLGVLGFDPNGKALDRLKFNFDREGARAFIKKQLDEMPLKVSQALTDLRDDSINGQGTNVIWAPVDLDAPTVKERSENEVSGRRDMKFSPDVEGLVTEADYLKRRGDEAADPALVGQRLPDHDRAKVDAVIAAAKGRGPDSVQKQVDKALKDLDDQIAAFRQVPPVGMPTTKPSRDLTPEETQQLAKLQQTRTIVESVGADEKRKAAETLTKFEKWAAQTPYLSDDTKRLQAKKPRFGLTAAPREVEEALARAKKRQYQAVPTED